MTTIAIIGQGSMGRAHALAWSDLGLSDDIKYVCAPTPGAPLPGASAARFVAQLDVVLADDDVDVVSVCTPTPSHPEIAIRALSAGKSVLLEKPIALTRTDALRIADVAGDSPGTFMVAHVVRFFEGYRMLREAAQAERFGVLRSVRASRETAPPPARWFFDESASGGVLVDFAIHDFDQLNLFLGTPLAASAIRGGRPGEIVTTVDYAGGGVGRVVTCAELPAGSPFSSSLRLEGELGGETFTYSPTSHDAPYTRQAAYFLDCVNRRVPPELCPVSAALTALDVSLAARESLRTGRSVPIS
ncbi:MAG: gfo/Idh/MocA family oxidoreductase [Microbacteriaceae bacterium]|jgi:predicted dehydrogenase|nr:gfo/Idh/MocA family oxidoreductase [Microbacteriaceae bacterium]